MYMREMPNSFFSRLLERVYVWGVHNSGIPLEKIIMLGMTLFTPASVAMSIHAGARSTEHRNYRCVIIYYCNNRRGCPCGSGLPLPAAIIIIKTIIIFTPFASYSLSYLVFKLVVKRTILIFVFFQKTKSFFRRIYMKYIN